ncbi:hypothetical protein D3C80_1604500 [compost metagenome]
MPARPGVRPLAMKPAAWLASTAMPTSSSAMSMYWPWPVLWRAFSAASTALLAYMPVNISITATPVRSGPPPGSASAWPVMLIRPHMAWTMRS